MTLSRRTMIGWGAVAIAATPFWARASNTLSALQADAPLADLVVTVQLVPLDADDLTADQIAAAVVVLQRRADMLSGAPQTGGRSDANGVVEISLGGIADPAFAVATLSTRGYLEAVDTLGAFPEVGTFVRTTENPVPITGDGTPVAGDVLETIISSANVVSAVNDPTQLSPALRFTLDDAGAAKLKAYSSAHMQQPLAIVIDNVVALVPVIADVIEREGIVTSADQDEIDRLLIQLNIAPLETGIELVDAKIATRATPTS